MSEIVFVQHLQNVNSNLTLEPVRMCKKLLLCVSLSAGRYSVRVSGNERTDGVCEPAVAARRKLETRGS